MESKTMPTITPEVAVRFWSHVDVKGPTDCWLWTGATSHGYGQVRINRRRIVYTHRVAYALMIGPPPEGFAQLDHLCRNRPCCNPKHLEVVSAQTNTLRGIGMGSRNAQKTHCTNKHPLSGSNLYLKHYKNGRIERVCLICRRTRQRIANSRRSRGFVKM